MVFPVNINRFEIIRRNFKLLLVINVLFILYGLLNQNQYSLLYIEHQNISQFDTSIWIFIFLSNK